MSDISDAQWERIELLREAHHDLYHSDDLGSDGHPIDEEDES